MSDMSDMSDAAVRVPRDVLDTVGILRESIVRNDGMKRGSPTYGSSSLEMHDVGQYGEHAVRDYLSQQAAGISLTEVGDYTSGDVQVFRSVGGSASYGVTHTLEVKSSRVRDWDRLGRALNETQLRRITSVAIVWCVVPDVLPADWVDIMGWLPLKSVRESKTNERLVLHQRQHVRVHEPMMHPADLLGWLDGLGVVPDPPF